MSDDSSILCDDEIESYESVDILACDFLGRYRNGDHPTVDEYVDRHPQWSDRIRQMFPLVLSLEKIKVERQRSSDGSATMAGRSFSRLGDFSIIREIGRGGMGIVFEAEQESLGRRVAIKILPKQSLLDEQALERFHREAKTAAAMHHSNIVPIFGTGETDGTHYIVMQLVNGRPLDRIIVSNEPLLDERKIASIGRQVADALAYAHAGGVLHRDVKPANILIEDNGTAQVTDFGLARNTNEDPTVTRTLSGSMRYMAPERFRGVSDERSDIYSLGLTLYEMLAGQPAFEETDPHQLMETIKSLRPKSLRSIRSLSMDLETIVLKAINPDAPLRYPTAAALRDDLDRFLSDEPIHARRMTWMQTTTRWYRRNRRLAAALALSVAALLVATTASTAGYLSTSTANQRTSEALSLSNETVGLALQALGSIVDVVSIPSSTTRDPELYGLDRDEFSLMSSPHSARVLERILPIYERLSEQSPTRPDIVSQMVEAGLRISQIQHQLGRNPSAVQSLNRTIDLLCQRSEDAQLTETENERFLTVLNNELGVYLAAELNFEAANKAHHAAIDLATNLPESDLLGKFERARAHLLLGDPSLQVRQGESIHPVSRDLLKEHLDRASAILEPIRQLSEHNPKAETLYAKVLLAQSRLAINQVVKHDRMSEGISILKRKLVDFPDDTSARFALVEALTDVKLNREWLPPRQNREAASRLTQALVELEPLRKRFPDAPIFAELEVRIWRGRYAVESANNHWELAASHLERAVDIQSELVSAWPNSMPHRCRRAILYCLLAKSCLARNNDDAAERTIEKAMADLDAIPIALADHPFVTQTRQKIAEMQNSVKK